MQDAKKQRRVPAEATLLEWFIHDIYMYICITTCMYVCVYLSLYTSLSLYIYI